MEYDDSRDRDTLIPPDMVACARQNLHSGDIVRVVDNRIRDLIIIKCVCAPKMVEFELTMTD